MVRNRRRNRRYDRTYISGDNLARKLKIEDDPGRRERKPRPRKKTHQGKIVQPVWSEAERERRRRHRQAVRRRRLLMMRLYMMAAICAVLLGVLFAVELLKQAEKEPEQAAADAVVQTQTTAEDAQELIQGIPADVFARHPQWEEAFLTPNEYSRPGDALTEVNNIFVHYTANPGTSAKQNRSYFEQQKDMHEASVSSHFIIGYEGEILQIVPLDEIAYAVMTRNMDSISIECCYRAEDGHFTQETYDSLIWLLSWLTDAYGLKSEDILRHYDCGGKKCPLYYTEHEDAWEQLKRDVDSYVL